MRTGRVGGARGELLDRRRERRGQKHNAKVIKILIAPLYLYTESMVSYI